MIHCVCLKFMIITPDQMYGWDWARPDKWATLESPLHYRNLNPAPTSRNSLPLTPHNIDVSSCKQILNLIKYLH